MIQARTFFITAVTYDRRPVFNSTQMADLFLNILFSYRDAGKFQLHQFVLMPDHFHCILTPNQLISLEKSMQFIKGGYSYQVKKQLSNKAEIWQRSFTEHRIHDARDYLQHVDYIHQNPVRRRLCKKAEEFPYSSARPGFVLDPPPEYLRG